LKIAFPYIQNVLKGKEMIQTDCIDSSDSDFPESYFSENEYRNSNDFLCIGEVQSWEVKPRLGFTPLSFTDLKALFAFSEDLQTIQCVLFKVDFKSEFSIMLEGIKS
jgi:hypothetical protein